MHDPPKILVVDDEYLNVKLMEAMLVPLGYSVEFARDGEEALLKVREASPDAILLDIMMPKLDGFEVARRLKGRKETRMIPIAMVTALGEVQHRVKALEAGADDFLIKPVDRTELRARVQSLLKAKAYNDLMIEHQRLLEAKVKKRTRQLKQALEKVKQASIDTVYRLSRAAEFKDEDTGSHIQRMSHYAAAIARRLHLNDRVVEAILYASSMHDIGKIGIPDHILLKPMKLDPAEWEIMKKHTIIGARILEGSGSGYIELARVIAITHHEKWDGSGYPEGLKGRKIPLVGRITAIADVFDALTSKRPYKESFSLEKSLNIIIQGSGNHLDPEVVEAFLSIQDEILDIKERYVDHDISLFAKMMMESGRSL